MQESTGSWYRHFWPYIVFGLPLVSIIASLSTVYIAQRDPDAMVVDDYYKAGLAINNDLARDRNAASMGVQAELSMHDGEVHLRLRAARGEVLDPTIMLKLIHPTFAEQDVEVPMARIGPGEFVAQAPELSATNWYVQLLPLDEGWRLTGRWSYPSEPRLHLDAGV